MPGRNSRNSKAVKQEQIYAASGRPQRGASRATQQIQYREDDDDEEEEDDDEEEVAGDGDESMGIHVADNGMDGVGVGLPPAVMAYSGLMEDDGRRRSSRDRKPVQHYDSLEIKSNATTTRGTGSVGGSNGEISPVLRQSGRLTKRRIADPDDDSDDGGGGGGGGGEDDGDYGGGVRQGPRKAFPTTLARQSRNSQSSAYVDIPPQTSVSYLPPTNGGGGRATRSAATKTIPPTPTKSRASSADAESFQPDASDRDGEGEEEVSDDPLSRDYIENEDSGNGFVVESDEEDEGRGYGRRNTRSTRNNGGGGGGRRVQPSNTNNRSRSGGGGGGGLRRSARTTAASARHSPASDEEYGGGRPKRSTRTRAPVNYALPSLDISTEIRQAELMASIQAASRPNGAARAAGGAAGGAGAGAGRGVRFGVGEKGWGGRDLTKAMGDDSSDSVSWAFLPLSFSISLSSYFSHHPLFLLLDLTLLNLEYQS